MSQQFNTAGSATIHFYSPPASTKSPEGSSSVTAAEAIAAVEREFNVDLRALARSYVTPDLQDFNPPDEMNSPSLIVSRQAAFQVVAEFVARPSLTEIGQRCLFVLGDAGMGKTSLLLMLAFRHFSAKRSPEYNCALLKLGPDTVERIAAMPNPARTILLLDSLDEDPAAHDHVEGASGRLMELLPRLVNFHRVVLTCRSQFFPENSPTLTTLPGHFVIGPFECPLKFISLFNDTQVEQYLRTRYQPNRVIRLLRSLFRLGEDDPKLSEARQAAKSMESLRLRPLLLSRIDDFVSGDDRPCVDFRNSYAVYHRLVDQWLMRDAQKPPLRMSSEESWRVAMQLALHLARHGQRKINRGALAQIEGLQGIPQFKLEARSLLNRNKDREYQFAHATISEFLVAHAILDGKETFEIDGIVLSREAYRFVHDGAKFLGRKTVVLRGARGEYPEAAVELVQRAFGLELVRLAPGEFLMGSPEDEPGRSSNETQHQVQCNQSFWIGRYPVTQGQYLAVMGENPSRFRGNRLPVESLDWHQAMAFCNKLTEQASAAGCLPSGFSFRLPTEAEWEYACRAGTTSALNDGSACTVPGGEDPMLNRLGWYEGNSTEGTHPVGEKLPNAWGLYDMHGNVSEWCLDGLRKYTSRPQSDPMGPQEPYAVRVVRGGSYWDSPGLCRSAFRRAFEPGFRDWILGFRLAAGQESGGRAPSEETKSK